MLHRLSIFSGIYILLLFFSCRLAAQGLNTNFGKKVIQYKEFDWSYYRTPNFDMYYYRGGKELARFLVDNAVIDLQDIETKIDYPLDNRITFVIYNSYTDYRQSNFRVNEEEDNITSPARTSENKVFLYFNGRHRDLQIQAKTGMARILVSEMILGGSVQERLQNNILLNLPHWYIEGLVRYLGKGWDVEDENILRNGVLAGKYKKLRKLNDEEATLVSQSIWKYIDDKYGPDALADMAYIMRNNKSVESAYLFVLGKPFIEIYEEWYQSQLDRFQKIQVENPAQPVSKKLGKVMKKGVVTNWDISVKGKYTAVVTNDLGKAKVWVVDLENGRKKKIFKTGYRHLSDVYDYNYPVIAWNSRQNELTLIIEKKAQPYYFHYNADERTRTKKQIIPRIDRILSLNYSPDGRTAVMSAVSKGQTDLLTFDFRSQRQRPLTDDVYDDLEPRYVRNGDGIVFSSNRSGVMLEKVEVRDEYSMLSDLDAFYFPDPESSKKLQRLSFSSANEFQPDYYDSAYLSYLSDEGGIINRHASYLDSVFRFIRVVAHTKDTAWRQNDTLLYYVNDSAAINVPYALLHDTLISSIDTEFVYHDTAYTYRLTNYSENLASYHILHSIHSIYELFDANGRYILNKRPMPGDIPKQALAPNMANYHKPYSEANERITIAPNTDSITVDRPYFQSDFPGPASNAASNTYAGSKSERRAGMGGRSRFGSSSLYFLTFEPDYFITQFDNSIMNSPYLPYKQGESGITTSSLNGMFKLGLSDVFKDYRIMGGFRMLTSFNGASYFLTAENLTKRIDKRLIFFRRGEVKNINAFNFYRETSYELRPEILIPFSETSSIHLSVFGRFDKNTYLTSEKASLQKPAERTYWGGGKMEYVLDNTIDRGINLYNGSRLKFYGEVFNAFNKKETLMKVVGADLRNYLPLARHIIWGNRLAAATSTGQAKIIYFLGGVDNWLFPQFNDKTLIDTGQNFVYKAQATNLRGFDQNVRNGNSYMVLNSEIRIPVFQTLLNRPIRQQFMENFQVVGFFDAGSAWVGTNPFSIDNSINRHTIEQYPFTITVISQRDPMVYGYGVGFRTVLMGYFIKFDLAWGVQDKIKSGRTIYLSFGTDF